MGVFFVVGEGGRRNRAKELKGVIAVNISLAPERGQRLGVVKRRE